MKCWFFKLKKRGKFGINNKLNHIRSVSSFEFFVFKIIYVFLKSYMTLNALNG